MDLAVLPGDDVGPEIVDAVLAVVEVANRDFQLGLTFETFVVGMARHRTDGTTLPDSVVEAASKADGVILGPAGMSNYPPLEQGGVNVPGTIRKRLDLYANLRPARSRQGLPKALPGLDCLIVRENTEGFYADRNMHFGYGEFMPTPDCALSVRKITREASRRIATTAFEMAARRRGRVAAIGKRHVLQVSDGLFFEEVFRAARERPDIELREIDVDAAAAALYTNPEAFDVILVTNMFGDILSNAAVAMSGGLGLAASLNRGDRLSAANAGHGSAPDIAGRDVANPTGLILSTAMLLEDIGARSGKESFRQAAEAVVQAVDACLVDPELRTPDVGGRGTTSGFAAAVARRVADGPA